MFEAAMGCARINEVGQRELMDVTETLNCGRVDHAPFIAVETHENVQRVANFMMSFSCHFFTQSRPALY